MTQTAGRPTVLRLPPGMRWQARDREGVGHLLPRRPATAVLRYLCNRMPVADRFAWPMRSRCAECVRLLSATTEQDRVASRAKADPGYRQMLMEDADLAAQHDAEGGR